MMHVRTIVEAIFCWETGDF